MKKKEILFCEEIVETVELFYEQKKNQNKINGV